MLTDNEVLVNRLVPSPALMCAQRRAEKKIVTEEDLIQSNIIAFGDEIGKITNRVTSMFDVIAQYEEGTKEYEVLDYRIKCGQCFQQNSIDKAKGIVAKPMPKEWYNKYSNRAAHKDDEEALRFNTRILADKKPYFMRYIYPALMRDYNTYISNTNKKALMEFRMTVEELLAVPENELSEEQKTFLYYYHLKMPVGTHDCVMNRICRRFEAEFDGYVSRHKGDGEFDYTIMKSGQSYTYRQYDAVKQLYFAYKHQSREYRQRCTEERIDPDESTAQRGVFLQEFRELCAGVCSNEQLLCDILLDLCYQREGSKQFVWDICSKVIIDNLLRKNDNYINFPTRSEDGDVYFEGECIKFVRKKDWRGYGCR